MTAALLLGAACGLSLWAAARLASPKAPPLRAALERLHRPPAVPAGHVDLADGGGSPVTGWLGRRVAALTSVTGLRLTPRAGELALAGRTAEQHLGAKALLGLVGALLPPVWAALVAVAGVRVPAWAVLAASVAVAAGLFALPDYQLRGDAARRRAEFTTALGSFLDLTVISLAGGSGVESALRDAAGVGDSWAFGRLRAALDAAPLLGQASWTALDRLGDELGVPALRELAASVSLAGTEGARVRGSLAAKAAALRGRQLADAETAAQTATEAMAVPTVLLLTGFLILLGYPALDALTSL